MITIITEPSFDKFYHLKKLVKNSIKRHILNRPVPKYAGHHAVVRSLLEGLNKIKYPFNYNPVSTSDIADHVHVLANYNALQKAIILKRKGKIKRLTAGPNIVISSADIDGFIASPEIDMYFVNSEWTKSAYLLDNPKLENRIGIWAAGINENDWLVEKKTTEKPVIVFYKKRPEHYLYEACKKTTIENGFEVHEIIYGNYVADELKKVLSRAKCVVYFVEQESQGIALQEIWATDTPTYVWNPQIWMYKGVNYRCSSAPYLTAQTGAFFRDHTEFENMLKAPFADYHPRQWLVANMTDEICAKDFLKKTH
jgi:hypothetical protein